MDSEDDANSTNKLLDSTYDMMPAGKLDFSTVKSTPGSRSPMKPIFKTPVFEVTSKEAEKSKVQLIKDLDYAPTDNDLFACSDCDSTFLRDYNLRRHKDTVHKKQVTWKRVKCASCGKEFSRKDNLLRHLKEQICHTLPK